MIADELRHARQCAGMVEALGGEAVAEMPEIREMPQHKDTGALEALLRNVLSICCLSETVAVSLISAEHLELQGGQIGQVLGQILGDEVQHARFGWDLLTELQDQIDEPMRERLGEYLVVAFRHLVEYELDHLPARKPMSVAVTRVGVCDGLEARNLFFDTIEDVIVPGLQAQGIDGQAAWQACKAA